MSQRGGASRATRESRRPSSGVAASVNVPEVLMGVAAGIAIHAAVTHGLVGLSRRPRDPVRIAFAAGASAAAVGALAVLALYAVDDVAAHTAVMKWAFFPAGVALTVATVWLVAFYADVRPMRWLLALSAGFCAVVALDLVLPYGLLHHELGEMSTARIAGAPVMVMSSASPHPLNVLIDALTMVAFAFLFYAVYRVYRRGERGKAGCLGLVVLLLSLTTLVDDFTDYGIVSSLYLTQLSFVAVVLAVSVALRRESLHAETELRAYRTQLESLVDARVKDLDRANEQLAEEVRERLSTEESLREGEERHRTILQTAMDGFWLADTQGRLLEVNEAYCRMSGHSAQELLTMRIPDLEAAETADDTVAHIEKVMAQGEDRFESRHRRKDGSEFDVEVSAQYWPLEGGRFVAFLQDITERKQAERELRKSEAGLRAAQAAAHMGSWTWHIKTNRLEWSDEMYRIFGIDKATFSGDLAEAISRALHPEDRHIVEQSNESVIRHGKPVPVEYRVVWPDQSVHVIWVEAGERLLDEAGNVATLSGYALDTTERKQAESYQEMGRAVLQILDEPGDLQDSLQLVLAALKTTTGFDAVGIRLQDGGDFPYFAEGGFSEAFLLTENALIERAADDGVCRDNDGNVCLECTCGLVISGKTDPADPFFTPGGSFWTNDSSPMLDIPPGEDPRLHPRNRCIHEGYASIALVPIRNKDGIVGLIQFNDRRTERFTIDMVEILEGIASHIGAALMRKRAEEALRLRVSELDSLQHITQTLAGRSDFGGALDAASRQITDLFKARDARVHLLADEAAHGQDPAFADATVVQQALAQHGVVDGLGWFGQPADLRERVTTDGVRHLLVVPMVARSETVGVLGIARDADSAAFSIGEQRLARTVADALAAVVEIERLHERETKQAAVEERQRLARDLHDAVTQSIYSASLIAEALPAVWERDPDEGLRTLVRLRRLVRAALAEMRTLLFELRPSALDAAPLGALLERLGDALAGQIQTPVDVRVADGVTLPHDVKLAFYRVTQEALSNIGKYAHATRVTVAVDAHGDGVSLTVHDDGKGFDSDAVPPEHMGLRIMRERLDRVGASLAIDSVPGRGTTLSVVWRDPGSDLAPSERKGT